MGITAQKATISPIWGTDKVNLPRFYKQKGRF
jgi:hypothetical protein